MMPLFVLKEYHLHMQSEQFKDLMQRGLHSKGAQRDLRAGKSP